MGNTSLSVVNPSSLTTKAQLTELARGYTHYKNMYEKTSHELDSLRESQMFPQTSNTQNTSSPTKAVAEETRVLLDSLGRVQNELADEKRKSQDLSALVNSLEIENAQNQGNKYKDMHEQTKDNNSEILKLQRQLSDTEGRLSKAESDLQVSEYKNKTLTDKVEVTSKQSIELSLLTAKFKELTDNYTILSIERDKLKSEVARLNSIQGITEITDNDITEIED